MKASKEFADAVALAIRMVEEEPGMTVVREENGAPLVTLFMEHDYLFRIHKTDTEFFATVALSHTAAFDSGSDELKWFPVNVGKAIAELKEKT
jgi:hypothetical protein